MTQKAHLEDSIKPPNLKRIVLKQDGPNPPSVVHRNLPSKCRQLCRLNLLFDVDGRLTEPCTACWIPAETARPVKIGPDRQTASAGSSACRLCGQIPRPLDSNTKSEEQYKKKPTKKGEGVGEG